MTSKQPKRQSEKPTKNPWRDIIFPVFLVYTLLFAFGYFKNKEIAKYYQQKSENLSKQLEYVSDLYFSLLEKYEIECKNKTPKTFNLSQIPKLPNQTFLPGVGICRIVSSENGD